MFHFSSSLRFRLILIVLLAVLPAMVLILYSGFEERRNAAARARNDTKRLVELASMHQRRLVDEAHRLLATLAQNPLLLTEDTNQCSTFLAEILKRERQYLDFGLIQPDGHLFCSAVPSGVDGNFWDRDYFKRALNEGLFAIGACQAGLADGKASIHFGYPVRQAGGTVKAILYAAVDLAWLADLADRFKTPEGASLTIIDRNGLVIARYPEPQRWVGKVIPETNVLRAALNRQDEGMAEAAGVDGVRRLYAFSPLDDHPHSTFLYTGIPTGTIYAEANRALIRNIIGLSLVTILALMAAHLFGNLFVMRRIDALVHTARQIAQGNMSARIALSPGTCELDQLGSVLNEMAESLEKRGNERDQMEAALRRSEARFRTLVEQIPVVTYVAALDETHTTVYVSPQIESLLGFDQEDFVGDPEAWSNKVHPDDRERVLREATRCQQENDLFVCEYRMLTFNGAVKWIRDEGVVVFSDTEEPLFMQGVMIDITEQKKAEEALRKAHDELEMRVEQRTRELAKANEDLRQSSEKLKFFAYSVVHDLKSPAIGAHGLARLLQKQYGDRLNEKGKNYCNQIMKSSEHMAELVDKINAYIATKETPLKMEPVRLGDILKGLREEFAPKLTGRGIQWLEPEEDVVVTADRLSLLRVFRNYVDNALKYGGEQLSRIAIAHEERDAFHVFSVCNDGQRLNQRDTERIFEVFQRTCSSNGVEGAGLGLAIVREVAERHGGQVWLDSNPETGTTFYISISKEMHPQTENDCEDAA